jgi:hypothetical protein
MKRRNPGCKGEGGVSIGRTVDGYRRMVNRNLKM